MSAADIRAAEGEPLAPETGISFTESARAKRELSTDLFRRRGAAPKAEAVRLPPTVDELRNFYQRVRKAQRSATEGDVHVLGQLRNALDKKLDPHLPDNMQQLRARYKGFIDTFPYDKLNALRNTNDPVAVSKFAFGQSPAIALDIVKNATPSERKVLQDAFANHALSDVDPEMPLGEQMKAVQKNLQPYVQNGTHKALCGPAAELEARNLRLAPIYRKRFAEKFNTPQAKATFEDAWQKVAKGKSATERSAAQAGFVAWASQLSPQDQTMLRRLLISQEPKNAPLPVMLGAKDAAQSAIQQRLLENSEKAGMEGYAKRRAAFAIPMAAGRMATSSTGAGAGLGIATGAAAAGFVASKAGYRALLKVGGARLVSKLYSSPGGRASAQAMFDLFSAIGSQAGEGATGAGDEQTQ